MDPLELQLDKAINEFNDNSNARKEAWLKKKELDKQIKDYDEKIANLGKVIQNLKDMIACGNLDSTRGYNELTENEQNLIVNGMDKTDYTPYDDKVPRWYDLEKLIKQVLDFKLKYPDWILKSVQKLAKSNTIPPKNYYKLTYLSSHGYHLTYEEPMDL
jgi:hypothetical protein